MKTIVTINKFVVQAALNVAISQHEKLISDVNSSPLSDSVRAIWEKDLKAFRDALLTLESSPYSVDIQLAI